MKLKLVRIEFRGQEWWRIYHGDADHETVARVTLASLFKEPAYDADYAENYEYYRVGVLEQKAVAGNVLKPGRETAWLIQLVGYEAKEFTKPETMKVFKIRVGDE